MNRKSLLLLLRLQFKSALLLLPRLFLTFLSSFLIACGIYFAGNEFLRQPASVKLPVALVLPEDDTYAGLAFSFIERMDSIRSVCSFERTDRESAISMLRAGNVYAVILIPDSFVEHILNGTNSAATLLFPREGSLESLLFGTLAEAGVSTLSTAQAGIYAMEDVMLASEKQQLLTEAEEKLNKLYLSYALNRDRIFHTENISSTSFLTIADYYICSALVLLILFSGMGLYSYFHAEPDSLLVLMRRQGISPFMLSLSKLTMIAVIYTLILFPLATLLGLLPFYALGGFFLFLFTMLSYLLFLGNLCRKQGSYIIVSAVLSILLLFVSGAFLPSVFLPDAVRTLGQLMPTTLFLKLLRELFTDSFTALSVVCGICTACLFLILSAALKYRQS